jgi:hypothetical protein
MAAGRGGFTGAQTCNPAAALAVFREPRHYHREDLRQLRTAANVLPSFSQGGTTVMAIGNGEERRAYAFAEREQRQYHDRDSGPIEEGYSDVIAC